VGRRPSLLLAAAALALVGGAPEASAQVQGPGIVELRRLIAQREPEIARLEARQRVLETRGDSLSQVKRRTAAGSAQFETVSNQIRQTGDQLVEVARSLRTLYEQMRDLRTKLYSAYNEAIAETSQRIERLPKTVENTAELNRLTETLRQYVAAREALVPEIEEAQDDLFLPDLVVDPTDGPSQLRVKEAIARDAVDKIDERIVAFQDQIETLTRKQRDREEFHRLRQDIELWGDRQAAQGGSEIEAMLEGRTGGRVGDVFDDYSERIGNLQQRLLDLDERRQEYAAKAAVFAQRLQEFYH
jgi:phage host-nuclease inhibitor protein Gam